MAALFSTKTTRYYLEIITVIAFSYIVIHMSGHGVMMLSEDHSHHISHNHEHHEQISFIGTIFETSIGIGISALFVWLWQGTKLKSIIPCREDNTLIRNKKSHIIAIIALCLHFIPESGVRHEVFDTYNQNEWMHILILIGFLAHIGIDIIIALHLSSYWGKKHERMLSFVGICIAWVLSIAFYEYVDISVSQIHEGVLLLFGGFILSMFIHMPHRNPVQI